MRAVAAWVLHILAVHYLFILFTIGIPCLLIGLYIKRYPVVRRFHLNKFFLAVFLVTLVGGFIFPPANVFYLQHFGMKGEAVVINSFENPGWFNSSPEIRLVLKVEPEDGAPFVEAVSTTPPLEMVNRLQVGYKVEVFYAPQYTHDVAIATWN